MEGAMALRLVVAAAFLTLSGLCGGLAEAQLGPWPSIPVIAYNHASASADVFAAAKSLLERIFAAAGVDIRWVDPAAPGPNTASALRLLVRRSEEKSKTQMGKAFTDHPECGGGTAFVFYAAVLHQAHREGQDPAGLLAYAMAHELGHLLLPAPGHSATGVMRPLWDGDDLGHIRNRTLAFTAAQAAMIARRATACDAPDIGTR
jgi:hypothetical protein